MKRIALLVPVFFLCGTACGPPGSTAFLAAFNPRTTLNGIGSTGGVSYANGTFETANIKNLFEGARIHRDWTFSFQGSHAQLLKQLDGFRAEVERQLSGSGATISGRGTWTGDFSGFSFNYASGRMIGCIRVTGVSFESGSQGLDILIDEH